MLTQVCKVDDIAPDTMAKYEVNGASIVLYRLGDEFYATQRRCTHAFAPLDRGTLADGRVVCPFHRAAFDVRTGAAVNWACWPKGIQMLNFLRPAKSLKTYPTKVEEGKVLVDV